MNNKIPRHVGTAYETRAVACTLESSKSFPSCCRLKASELQDIYNQLRSECRIISINYFFNQSAYYGGRRCLDEPIFLWQPSRHTENKRT
jgi:hypothetical protein